MLNMQFAAPVSDCLGEHLGDSTFTFALPCIMVSWEKRCIHLRMKGEKKLNKKKMRKRNTERRDGGGTWVMHVDERMNATNLGNSQSIAFPK